MKPDPSIWIQLYMYPAPNNVTVTDSPSESFIIWERKLSCFKGIWVKKEGASWKLLLTLEMAQKARDF